MIFYNSSILRADTNIALSTISSDWDLHEKYEKNWFIIFDSLFFLALSNYFSLSIPRRFLILIFFSSSSSQTD